MGNSNATLRFVVIAIAVVASAFSIGYFIIGNPRTAPTPSVTVVPAPASAGGASIQQPTRITLAKPRVQNGDYTAPGAPKITIIEDKTPSLLDTSDQQPKLSSTAKTSPTQSDIPQPPQPLMPVPSTITPNEPSDNAPVDPDQPSNVNVSASSSPTGPSPTNPVLTQDPNAVGAQTDTGQPAITPTTDQKALFRVQTGSFETSKNAKEFSDILRQKGYSPNMRSEREGSKTVYKIQVGAFQTRSAADKAASELETNGYPAYVSPISP